MKVKIEGDRGYWTAESVFNSYEFAPTYPPGWKYCGAWKWQSRLYPGFVLEVALHLNRYTGMVDEFESQIRPPYEGLGLKFMAQKAFETMYVIPPGCPVEKQLLLSDLTTWPTIRHCRFVLLFPKFEGVEKFEIKLHPGCFLSWTCTGCTKSLNDDATDDSAAPICKQRKCKLGGRPI